MATEAEKIEVTSGPWTFETFVDNRQHGSGHHTYKITPQRGPYGSMFEADARLAAASHELLSIARDYRGSIEFQIRKDLRDGDEEGANMKRLTLGYVDHVISKAEGRS